jgi:hypothetical protein
MRVGHALWRDRRKLGDTVAEREGINAALESVWKAKREYRAELAKKRTSRFSEFRASRGGLVAAYQTASGGAERFSYEHESLYKTEGRSALK